MIGRLSHSQYLTHISELLARIQFILSLIKTKVIIRRRFKNTRDAYDRSSATVLGNFERCLETHNGNKQDDEL